MNLYIDPILESRIIGKPDPIERVKSLDSEGNRFQITQGDGFTYYVDLKKGVVAAVMNEPEEEARKYTNKIASFCADQEVWVDIGLYSAFEKTIRAKAKCSEEDDFSLEYGMKLAKERCLAKYYKELVKLFVDINNRLDPILCYIEDQILCFANRYEKFNH